MDTPTAVVAMLGIESFVLSSGFWVPSEEEKDELKEKYSYRYWRTTNTIQLSAAAAAGGPELSFTVGSEIEYAEELTLKHIDNKFSPNKQKKKIHTKCLVLLVACSLF